MIRVTRSSPQRARQLWAAAAAGVVAVVALALWAVGVADRVEFLATLLVAPVIVATLLSDRNLGYVTAAAASVAYLALRFDDIRDAGALGVIILVLCRAGSYGFVAYITPLLAERLGFDLPEARSGARHLRVDVDDPVSDRWAAHDPPADEWDVTPLGRPAPAWQAAQDDYAEADAYAPVGVAAPPAGPAGWDDLAFDDELHETRAGNGNGASAAVTGSDFARAWQDSGEFDHWSPESAVSLAPPSAPPPPPPPSAPPRAQAPPAPRVPTGWIDDATSPIGDETIPVGYTGELFLGKELGLLGGGVSAPQPWPSNGGSNGHGQHHPDEQPRPGNGIGAPAAWETPPPAHSPPARAPQPPPAAPRHQYQPPAPPPEPQLQPDPAGRRPAPTELNPSVGIDAETRLWNAQFFRDRLTAEVDSSRQRGSPFSIVMIQVADEPFQPLPYRRQVALLRELGHQFVPRFVDHLVHLPDGAQHWFAVVLPDTDKAEAHAFERRLRTALSGYLRSRGLRVEAMQSASLTSPDDDEAMATVWASLLGAPA